MTRLNSRLPWAIVITSIGVMCIVLLILLIQFMGVVDQYNQLSDEYMRIGDSAQTLYTTLLDVSKSLKTPLSLPPEPKPSIPASPINGTGGLLLILFGLCITGISQILLLLEFKKRFSEQALDNEQQVRRAHDLGRADGLRTIALGLIQDEDVLAEMVDWLQKYRRGDASLDDSAKIHAKILERLVKQVRITPFGETGFITTFDPAKYTTFDRLKPGEEVIVVEPGWRVAREIVKLPVVRRKS